MPNQSGVYQLPTDIDAEFERTIADVTRETQGRFREFGDPMPFDRKPFTSPVTRNTETTAARAELAKIFEPERVDIASEMSEISNLGARLEILRHRALTERRPGSIQEAVSASAPKSSFSQMVKLITGDEDSLNKMKLRFTNVPTRRELIQRESELGGRMFGDIIPSNVHRQYYNLDQDTWIFYEENNNSAMEQSTTRYEVHPNGVLKVQEGSPYYYIEGQELDNFVAAGRLYYDQVARIIYNRDPATGNPLAT